MFAVSAQIKQQCTVLKSIIFHCSTVKPFTLFYQKQDRVVTDNSVSVV